MDIKSSIEEIRQQFPALTRLYNQKAVAYFDGPGGSQMVQSSIDGMVRYMVSGGANLHGAFPSSVETEAAIASAREHAAALLGASPDEIAFGANMTTLNMAISRALCRDWSKGDKVVVTELDHRANVDPWLRAAADKGAEADWIRVNSETLTLDLDSLDEIITPGTRVVAVGLASNGVGTVTNVRAIADKAHEVGALVVVDAVHAAPHIAIDRDELGADILLCSAYKFFGPHMGIACVRRDVFNELGVYKIEPAPTQIPDKLETGTQNHEGMLGIVGAIDFIASLGEGESLRDRILSAMSAIEAYEEELAHHLRTELRKIDGVTVFAAAVGVRKTPTVSFIVKGVPSRRVCEILLAEKGIFAADGNFYASTLADKLGVEQHGGWVRAGLAPYNTLAEVEDLIDGVKRIASKSN